MTELHHASLTVDAARRGKPIAPIWNWVGYDEPNYTYLPYGRRLLADLAALSRAPVHVRMHNLLTSGDGTPALKWGSTGVYREDADGRPAYSWAIIDRIFDALTEAGLVPMIQAGFMPEALSSGPEPYRHDFPRTGITAGWAYPPKDYGRWGALIEAWARHLVERYGMARVATWPWEVWNEPDGLYWCGNTQDFCRLHDVADAAIRRAIPEARVGGPHTCGPTEPKAAAFLRAFLEHCARGRNAVTGALGTRLDFIAFHAKGRPQLVDGHVRMGLAHQLRSVAAGLDIVSEFPEFADLPVVLGESDPEGCAACPSATHPENAYRDGPLYGASIVEATMRTLEIAERAGRTIEGAVTWAFEFEGAPFFAGYRELATNGIAKPALNALRLMAKLDGDRLAAHSDGALALDAILADGVVAAPDIDLAASATEGGVNVLIWNYHDDDLPAAGAAEVSLAIGGLSDGPHLCRHLRVDADHANAAAVFRTQGAPAQPTSTQYAALEKAGTLTPLETPRRLQPEEGAINLKFTLPRHAVSLLALSRI